MVGLNYNEEYLVHLREISQQADRNGEEAEAFVLLISQAAYLAAGIPDWAERERLLMQASEIFGRIAGLYRSKAPKRQAV